MDGYHHQTRVLYGFKQPQSKILLAECTKEWARTQVKKGAYPEGSIWIPGCCDGKEANPGLGDLFAPDPNWKPAFVLDAAKPEYLPHQTW